MEHADDRSLNEIEDYLRQLPELSDWGVHVLRGDNGHLICELIHRAGRLQLATRAETVDEARLIFVSLIRADKEIAFLNRVPESPHPILIANLRAGLRIYRWNFQQFCDVLLALRDAAVLGRDEMDWLIAGGRRIPGGKPEYVGKDSNGNDIWRPWGSGQLPPWQMEPSVAAVAPSASTGSSESSEGQRGSKFEELQSEISRLPVLGVGWKVRIVAGKAGIIRCELEHELLSGTIDLVTKRAGKHSALDQLREQIERNEEVVAIASAPEFADTRLLGRLRLAARNRQWSPFFYFGVLERLHIAELLSGFEVLWAMEAGPVGDPGWRHQLGGTAIAEYASWREATMPTWRQFARPRASSA
jgi:hypothetical protein